MGSKDIFQCMIDQLRKDENYINLLDVDYSTNIINHRNFVRKQRFDKEDYERLFNLFKNNRHVMQAQINLGLDTNYTKILNYIHHDCNYEYHGSIPKSMNFLYEVSEILGKYLCLQDQKTLLSVLCNQN